MKPSSTIAIAGATGFVGANLCRYFLDQGMKVLALTGPATANWRLPDHSSLSILQIDLTAVKEIALFVRTCTPDYFINCAAYGAYPSQTNREQIYDVNFNAVRHLLECLYLDQRIKGFIQAGSSSEYGLNCEAPMESSDVCPDSHYAVSKAAASAAVRYYGKKLNLPAWVFRLYSVYGPWEESSRLIPTLLRSASHSRLPPLVDKRISRDFVFVEDVCNAFGRLIRNADQLPRGEIYNIGTGTCVTLEELVECSRKLFRINEEPQWGSMPNRSWDNTQWMANPTKAKRDFSWQATTSIADGLVKTYRWMEANPTLVSMAMNHSILTTVSA